MESSGYDSTNISSPNNVDFWQVGIFHHVLSEYLSKIDAGHLMGLTELTWSARL